MWIRSYFPAAYFAPRYFPGNEAEVAPDLIIVTVSARGDRVTISARGDNVTIAGRGDRVTVRGGAA